VLSVYFSAAIRLVLRGIRTTGMIGRKKKIRNPQDEMYPDARVHD
jgi:hypothetical protein